MAISMLKIRRPLGRLIFNMGIAIPGKTVFLIETAPWGFKPSVIKSLAIIYLMLLLVIQDGSFDISEKKKPFQRVKNTYMNPHVIPDTYTVILLFM